jgi:hypothetical protein
MTSERLQKVTTAAARYIPIAQLQLLSGSSNHPARTNRN